MPYRTVFLSLALASILTACGGDSTGTGPSDPYSGTYRLISVNGKGLPYVIPLGGGDQYELLTETLTLTDNGTDGGSVAEARTERFTSGGQVRTENGSGAGTYTRSGTGVAFSLGGSLLVGTIGGGKITIDMTASTGTPCRVFVPSSCWPCSW